MIYDGHSVTKPGGIPDPAPVRQSAANADFIRQRLAELTGRNPHSLPIHPVLLFPGWYVDGSSSGRDVWVFGDRTLHRWLPNEPRRLSPSDIALFYESLSTYIRNFNK